MVKQHEEDALVGPYVPFAMLSGGAHTRATLDGVLKTARRDICVHRSAMPVLPSEGDGGDGSAINAYVYDFHVHGHFATIVKDNGVSSGEAWQVYVCVYA